MTLADLRLILTEASHHARGDPVELGRSLVRVWEAFNALSRAGLGFLALHRIQRLRENLEAGARAREGDPAVLEGYLAGAVWELAEMEGRP